VKLVISDDTVEMDRRQDVALTTRMDLTADSARINRSVGGAYDGSTTLDREVPNREPA
jgi:hypothetical protein